MNPASENDAHGPGTWPGDLRARLLSVARRRVPDAVAEDLVQDALRIVLEKGVIGPGAVGPGGVPGLAFAFRVLRNVIGNHYQRERVRERTRGPIVAAQSVADPAPTPLEALTAGEAARFLREGLAAVATSDPACARCLTRLLDGLTPRELAREEGVEEAVLYRRMYRCRQKLREVLEERGMLS